MARHVRLAAARLLWAGFGVADSLDSLRILLARRGEPEGAVLVAIDLFVTGQVELAQWGPAVVRRVTPAGDDSVVAGPLNVIDKVADRDWLAAMPAVPFPGLPRHGDWAARPCETRDLLVQGLPAEAPPLVIAKRVEPRVASAGRSASS